MPVKREDHWSIGDRLMGVVFAAFVSLPLVLVYWLVLNYWGGSAIVVPLRFVAFGLGGTLLVVGFVSPKTVPEIVGWLTHVLFALGRY